MRFSKEKIKYLFLKFKGAGKLSNKELNRLEHLLILRNKIAKKKNVPPFKVFGNRSLMQIVRKNPKDQSSLKKMNLKDVKRYSEKIIRIIKKAIKVKKNNLPMYPKSKKIYLSMEEGVRIKKIKEYRDKKAKALKIEPSLILTKEQIIYIAIKNPQTKKEFMNFEKIKKWQRKEFAEEILRLY